MEIVFNDFTYLLMQHVAQTPKLERADVLQIPTFLVKILATLLTLRIDFPRKGSDELNYHRKVIFIPGPAL